MTKLISIESVASQIFNEKSVAIFTHIRPDGDAIGSSLALFKALKQKGISACLYFEEDIPERFSFITNGNQIEKILQGEYSAFVSVDCADSLRLGAYMQAFLNHKNTYSIDHHISNLRYAKQNYINDNASNCENIYQLLTSASVEITKDIADCLAMGIMTDTGGFRHKNVTESTLLTVSKLVKNGADLNEISYHMFTEQSKERAKLFGLVMQKIRYFQQGRFAVITISKETLRNSGARADETEGFIDFVMGIKGIEVGASVMEMDNGNYKISFRSKKADVNAVASTFGGGGHVLASGCQICGEYEEVVDKINFAVSRYIED